MTENNPVKIRIGFVGVGNMGQAAHLRNYATLPECQVVALCEVKRELGQLVAQRYGIPRVYENHQDMLAAEKLDGIVASQPFTRHGSLVPQLLQAKTPLFTEKPLAGSPEMGRQILQALATSGTWHMVGYHKRSDPATQYAKAQIEQIKQSGELGKLRYVRILMPAGDWIANGFFQNLKTEEKVAGLLADPPASDMDKPTYDQYLKFVNYYIHQVNLMRHLLGESYRVSYADPAGVLLTGHSVSGVPVTIEMSPYSTTLDWQESALVCFEHGWIKLELPAPLAINRPGQVTVFKDPGSRQTPVSIQPQLPWVGAMRQQAQNFLLAIRGQIQPPCQAQEAMEDLEIARQYIKLRLAK